MNVLTVSAALEKLQGVRLEESPGNKENDKAKGALELLSQVNSLDHQNEAGDEAIQRVFLLQTRICTCIIIIRLGVHDILSLTDSQRMRKRLGRDLTHVGPLL